MLTRGHAIGARRLIRAARADVVVLGQSRSEEAVEPIRAERGVTETVVTALVVGGAVGGYVGYQVGNWRAAHRAARATYRTQRGLR